ncbi:hypothetical protein TWF694_002290 [Orbilia ellipsospora]|uniref:Uncharacterized protein n=1 Tax=Orbilia ellipsospora TaxID=2528407 RepID=A0AAV9X1M0_9PEZI
MESARKQSRNDLRAMNNFQHPEMRQVIKDLHETIDQFGKEEQERIKARKEKKAAQKMAPSGGNTSSELNAQEKG